MKLIITVFLVLVSIIACNQQANKEELKKEIYQTEKAFEKMSVDKGLQEAFYFFASDSAVIKRQNDTLIVGKENIKNYYSNSAFKKAKVTWTPDFIDGSDDGNMAYTYGKYLWRIWNENGDTTKFKGVFHTVWKRESDGNWKYVWD